MKAFGNIEKDSQIRAVASGAISSGKPVVINSDGTVSEVSGADEALGSIVAANSLVSGQFTTVFDSSNNKHVIVYRTSSNMRYVVATIASDGGVTLGTDAVAEASDNQQIAGVFDSTNNRIVVAYRRGDDSDHGHCLVGSLSGTTVTWGSPTEFNNAANTGISLSFDTTAGKGVVSYKNGGNSNYGTARVFTVSGTSISFGTAVVFNSGSTDKTRSVYDSTNNKIVIGFSDDADSSKGKAVVGTISGTDITFGSEVQFEQGQIDSHGAAAFDSDQGKVVFAYRQNASSGGSTAFKRGTAVVGTVSGTSISFGTPVAFDNTGDYGENTPNGAVYDTNAKKVLVVYPRTIDGSYSNRGHVFPLKVDGTTIVADTPNNFNGAATAGFPAISFDTNVNKSLIAFRHDSSEYASAVSYSPLKRNLTSENFLGFMSGEIRDDSRTQAIGTAVQYESGDATQSNITFDSTNNKIVITYRDSNNSNYASAIVGTVDPSDNSISFGSSAVFSNSSTAENKPVFDSANGKVVIAYSDGGNSNYGTAVVGTVSGTSISFGTPVVYNSGNATVSNGIAFDSNSNRVVISYKDQAQSDHGKAIVGSVSGTSISFGTEVTFRSQRVDDTSMTFDSTNNKVVIVWSDDFHNDAGGGGGYGRAVVGTVDPSDNSISFGSIAEFASHRVAAPSIGFDPVAGKVVIAHEQNGTALRAIVGTVSGTSISFGTAVQYSTATDQSLTHNAVAFDSSAGKIAIAFKDETNSVGKLIAGTVSGTSITFDDEITLFDTSTQYGAVAYDSNSERLVVQVRDTDPDGKAIVVALGHTTITRQDTATSNSVKIDTKGAVINNQTSLTAGQQYFVQNDGTISETADDPSVFAGTAISATELIVKG